MANLFSRYLHTIPSPSPFKSSIIDYLTESLGFSKPRALSLSTRFSSSETNPQSVIQLLKSLGFNSTDIQNWVDESPQILFADAEKTLKPRIQFFQNLGLAGSELSKFISKNPGYLSNRFERLKPCVDVIKELMNHDNENLIRTLTRCNWADIKQPVTRISANIKYLEQCGIVGSQLVTITTRQPRLLIMGESELKDLVSKVLDMGFSLDSRMLVHALYTLSCMSDETIKRKFKLFQSFGFTKVECLDMFKRAPGLFRVSESKLNLGIEFFLNTVKFDKAVLVRRPTCLMLSLEERVIPRYKILNILTSKKILKKTPKFLNVMWLPEDEFLEKFISKNRDYADELLLAYKCGDLVVPKE
ncbi:transcription termination factor MTERF5, chloroplastic [Lactuca sativa]|uniref:Uncharacterized protein n=1 Tax=Lactuca sativa TaxID=4236 RepID=A0A9R1W3B6_LACSA|nr:transcription termination factor MTERF5, chloroplastic [Lactuca sativa]KAJ0215411.1 hypothetical protein LSAT_V11C300147680 [Lactuca sativa]